MNVETRGGQSRGVPHMDPPTATGSAQAARRSGHSGRTRLGRRECMLAAVNELPMEETLRPLDRTDVAGVLELLQAMDVAETGSVFTTEVDACRILDNGRTDLDRDSRAVSDPGGLAAFAAVETLEDREYVRATLGLRLEAAGVTAPVLLGWVERRAYEVALGAD